MKQTENGSGIIAAHEEACARVSARFSQHWLRHYAASKLRSDPIFRAAAELLLETDAPLLDVGAGVGLLPFYLRERGFAGPVTGLEIDSRKVERARVATTVADGAMAFFEQDALAELPEFSGNVALVDVLHYLTQADQARLLHKLAERIAPGCSLIIRDCPRDGSWRFWTTYAAEIFAQTTTWNIGVRLHFPTRASINAAFHADQFTMEERPMYQGGPFNNRLFVFRRL